MTAESRARAAMLGRGGGRCEICRGNGPLEGSHRVARSRGGTWDPPNIVGACPRCHRWLHAEPAAARDGGWHLETGSRPDAAPVYLRSVMLWPGWFLLDERGDAAPTYVREEVPRLPDWAA